MRHAVPFSTFSILKFRVANQSTTETGESSTTRQQASVPVPALPKAEASHYIDTGGLATNHSVGNSEPFNATWISMKGKQKRTANGTDWSSRRRQQKLHSLQTNKNNNMLSTSQCDGVKDHDVGNTLSHHPRRLGHVTCHSSISLSENHNSIA